MPSAEVEPAFAHIVGYHFKLYEEAKTKELSCISREETIKDAVRSWWLAMSAMNWITISLRCGYNERKEPDFIHASLAVMNEMLRVNNLIREEQGYSPMDMGWELEMEKEA